MHVFKNGNCISAKIHYQNIPVHGPLTGYVYMLNSSASEKAIISIFLCFLSLPTSILECLLKF